MNMRQPTFLKFGIYLIALWTLLNYADSFVVNNLMNEVDAYDGVSSSLEDNAEEKANDEAKLNSILISFVFLINNYCHA